MIRQIRVYFPEECMDKMNRVGETDIRADAVPLSQFHGEPALHAFALDEDDFARERVIQGSLQDIGKKLRQQFHPVARK
jgi:hypothetical protein